MTQPNRYCEQCGADYRPNARFCWSCGQPLHFPSSSQKSLNVVICYAHEDEALRDALIKQLSVLQRQGLVVLWHDRDINAGNEWANEIGAHLNHAHIILLLVSPDFIASDYCYSVEMQRALERHDSKEARIIPIILRPVYWQGTPLGKLQALPGDSRPVSSWKNIDEGFFNVAEGIRKVVEKFPDQARSVKTSQSQAVEEKTSPVKEPDLSAQSLLGAGRYAGRLFGSYRLIHLLGKGGFAEVYLAEDIRSTGSQAAVKIMQGPLMWQAAEDFLDAVQTLARLVHPNIIRILDFGLEEATPFLAMSYASNGNLREHYPKGVQLPLSTIVLYVKQIADALQYAHDKRIVHGDLKPENLLLGPHNELWISDFNLQDVDTSSVESDALNAISTTVPYMAPEQLNGMRRLPATDQYALGIIVYEWLCGYRPFSGSTIEVAMQHSIARPPTLQGKVKIPLSMESTVMKALSKDPNRRYNCIRDFALAFERASLS